MDVILDTNILASDPWLQSRRLALLKEYILKTRGRLVLLEAVETELRGHVVRGFRARLDEVEASLRNAARLGIAGLPEVDSAALLHNASNAWQSRLDEFFRGYLIIRPKTDPGILPELLTRSAHRLPPVSPNGRATRDTIVWLSTLAFLTSSHGLGPAAFISANTQDFADKDGSGFRNELLADVATIKRGLEYYESLEAFLAKYASPVEHISGDWVLARISDIEAREKIDEAIRRSDADRLFRLHGEYAEYYEPRHVRDAAFDAELNDCVFRPMLTSESGRN